MFGKRKKEKIWNPKGGEFEIMPMLVDIEEITGPPATKGEQTFVRPDSGNLEAKRAMVPIILDFIMGKPLDERKLERLDRALPEEPAIPMFIEEPPVC